MGREMSYGETIGTLAKAAGVNVETIRYYQRRGLLQEPPKPPAGYRRYSQESLHQVRFIRKAQGLGFTLEEISGLMQLDERKACKETRAAAALKLDLIEKKLSEISRIRRALKRLIRSCDAQVAGDPCPMIHLLNRG